MILPVHYAGRPADMDGVRGDGHGRRSALVEDAAHCVEGAIDGRKVGSIGDFTCFSFYATKNLTTGEGGMVTTADGAGGGVHAHGVAARHEPRRLDALRARRLAALRRGDRRLQIQHDGPAGGDRPAPARAHRRDARAARGDLRALRRRARRPAAAPARAGRRRHVHARHLYPVLVDEAAAGMSRDALQPRLRDAGISTSIHFRALHLHPYYQERFGFRRGMFPVAEAVSDTTLSLPLSAAMPDDAVDRVIEACHDVLR